MPELKIIRIISSSDHHDRFHPSGLLDIVRTKAFKGKSGRDSNVVVLKLEKEEKIKSIDIGNEFSAFVEVLVAKSCYDEPEFQTLLPSTTFMEVKDCREEKNGNRVQMFCENHFIPAVQHQKWDIVKIICRQPFNKRIPYGISFIRILGGDEDIHTPILKKNITNDTDSDRKTLKRTFFDEIDKMQKEKENEAQLDILSNRRFLKPSAPPSEDRLIIPKAVQPILLDNKGRPKNLDNLPTTPRSKKDKLARWRKFKEEREKNIKETASNTEGSPATTMKQKKNYTYFTQLMNELKADKDINVFNNDVVTVPLHNILNDDEPCNTTVSDSGTNSDIHVDNFLTTFNDNLESPSSKKARFENRMEEEDLALALKLSMAETNKKPHGILPDSLNVDLCTNMQIQDAIPTTPSRGSPIFVDLCEPEFKRTPGPSKPPVFVDLCEPAKFTPTPKRSPIFVDLCDSDKSNSSALATPVLSNTNIASESTPKPTECAISRNVVEKKNKKMTIATKKSVEYPANVESPLLGIVFTLSGFQNPIRAQIRERAMSLGAVYSNDLTSKVTHIISAFRNTPKAKQAGSNVFIVSSFWVDRCKLERRRLDEKLFSFKQ